MKKAFISILLFYLFFHFVIPYVYFSINGIFFLYSNVEDQQSTNKVFYMNCIVVLLSCLIIYILPVKSKKIEPRFDKVSYIFYAAALYSVFYLFLNNGFEGLISGAFSGSIYSYLNFFLNPYIVLCLILFYQKKNFSIIFLFFLYVVIVTIAGSRSGVLSLLSLFLIYPAFINYDKYKKKIKLFFSVGFILAPLLFIWATSLRGADIDSKLVTDYIMARVSFLESGMIPVHYKDNGLLDLSAFNEKYGIVNQVKLIIDSVIPGNVFAFDVMPNQYYRSFFLGYDESYIIDNYTSINISLPVYFYMFSNFFFACLFSIIFIVSSFLIANKFANNVMIVVVILTGLYGCLVYFDWVMSFSKLLNTVITIMFFYFTYVCRTTFIRLVRKSKLAGASLK